MCSICFKSDTYASNLLFGVKKSAKPLTRLHWKMFRGFKNKTLCKIKFLCNLDFWVYLNNLGAVISSSFHTRLRKIHGGLLVLRGNMVPVSGKNPRSLHASSCSLTFLLKSPNVNSRGYSV